MVGEVGTVFTQSCRMNGVHHVVKDQAEEMTQAKEWGEEASVLSGWNN